MSGKTDGGSWVESVPEGDNRSRLVCSDCGFVRYDNPKVVVGAVCLWDGKVLLCRRAIPPRRGFWTIPAGFLELGESTAEGAKREIMEEAGAEAALDTLIGIYDIPHISQVYVIYRGVLTGPRHAAGPESAEVALFEWDRIPWEELAFPSVAWALRQVRTGAPSEVAVAPAGS